jgi:hypothetical protein
MGLITAHAHTDAARAKKEFLDLAAAAPSKVTDREYSRVASALAEAGHLKPEAQEVLEAGIAAYSESIALKAMLDELDKPARPSGDSETPKAIDGLGYGGGK